LNEIGISIGGFSMDLTAKRDGFHEFARIGR